MVATQASWPTMSTNNQLPDIIKETLDRFRNQQWLKHILDNAVFLCAAGLLYVLFLSLADAWLHWADTLRFIGAGIFWALVAYIFIKELLLPLYTKPNLVDIAHEYEQHFPQRAHNNISSAVDFCINKQIGVSEWMMQRCVAIATQTIKDADDINDLHQRPLQKKRKQLIALTAIWLICLVPFSSRTYILRNTLPWLNIPRPTAVRFIVEPGNIQISSGTDVVLNINTKPAVSHLECLIRWDDGHQEQLPCTLKNERLQEWELDLGPALESFSYVLLTEEAESPRYHISIGAAAQINDISLQLTPPDYIKEQVRHISTGDADILKGSRIQFSARIQHFDLHHAALKGDNEWNLPLRVESDGNSYIVSGEWLAEQTQHYSLHLWNQKGLHHQHPQQWFLRVLNDAPPQLHTHIPLSQYAISSPTDNIFAQIQAEDDFAIGSLALTFGNQNEILDSQNIEIDSGQKSINKKILIKLRQWQHQIGDRLWIEARCVDNAGQSITSERVEWIIGQHHVARLADHGHQMQSFVNRIMDTLHKASLLTQRWVDIRSNMRVDDIQAQSGDLLQADQQMNGIQKDIRELGALLKRIKPHVAKDYKSGFDWISSYADYILHHHCRLFNNRGSKILQTPKVEISTLLDNSITDSELLLFNISQLNEIAFALEARLAVDVLEEKHKLNHIFIQSQADAIRGSRLWSEPLYKNALRCYTYNNKQLKGKPLLIDYRSLSVNNDHIANVGNENFSLKWIGEIYLPIDGQWIFEALSDDGIQISIDEQSIISEKAWTEQAETNYSSSLSLKQGWHKINIQYFQGLGDSKLSIKAGLKGAKLEPIIKYKMRSPIQNQKSYDIIYNMLNIYPQKDAKWDDCRTAIQDIIDTSLTIHQWAINLSDSNLHRHGQAFNKTCKPYNDYLDTSPLHGALDQALTWKPIRLSHHFHDARHIIKTHLQNWQLPIERNIVFDDLVLHIYLMEQMSKSLKDWGLPYEHIAKTHRFLQRLKEQAVSLYHVSNNNQSQLVSEIDRSYGERYLAWKIAHQLSQHVLDKINGLEIDNHNVIWQLPALRDMLIKIHGQSKTWHIHQPTSLFATLRINDLWLKQKRDYFSSYYAHFKYYFHTMLIHNGSSKNKIDVNILKKWDQFNKQNASSPITTLEQFNQKHASNKEIHGRLLNPVWQIALLHAEYAFTNNRKNEGLSSLSLALELQKHFEEENVELSKLKRYVKNAHNILRGQKSTLERFYSALMVHEDKYIQQAQQLHEGQSISNKNYSMLLNQLNNIPAPPDLTPHWKTWNRWQQELHNAIQQHTTSLQDVLRSHNKNVQDNNKLLDALMLRLKETQTGSKQQLRWQSLGKDLKKIQDEIFAAYAKAEKPFLLVKVLFKVEAQIAIHCQEQADYTRGRLSTHGTEDKFSIETLNKLISLRNAIHTTNEQLIDSIKQHVQTHETVLDRSMNYVWSRYQSEPNKAAYSFWTAINTKLNDARRIRNNFMKRSVELQIIPKSKSIRTWNNAVKEANKHMQPYWIQSAGRQQTLTTLHEADKIAALHMLTKIDLIHLDTLSLIHHYHHFMDVNTHTWDSTAQIISVLIADLTVRQLAFDDSVLVLQNIPQANEDHIGKAVKFWQNIPMLQSADELRNAIQAYQADNNTPNLALPDPLQKQADQLVNLTFAHASRLLQQQGIHVADALDSETVTDLHQSDTTQNDYQKRYEQQWQHGRALIEMRSQYEFYDAYNHDQQQLIFDYFNKIGTSEP